MSCRPATGLKPGCSRTEQYLCREADRAVGTRGVQVTRFLMATHGTDGDVLPFIRFGRVLRERGHEVVLLSHAHYAGPAGRAGLQFVGVDTVSEFERNLADTGDLVDAVESAQLRRFFDRNDLFSQL